MKIILSLLIFKSFFELASWLFDLLVYALVFKFNHVRSLSMKVFLYLDVINN
jgi:hypothetical protein